MREDLLAREHLAGVTEQVLQQGELFGAQGNDAVAPPRVVRGPVQGQVGQAQLSGAVPQRGAPRAGPHAREQLGEREGLAQVVLGPRVQTGDAILHLVAGRQHEHGRAAAGRAQAPAHLQPVQPRHQDVPGSRHRRQL